MVVRSVQATQERFPQPCYGCDHCHQGIMGAGVILFDVTTPQKKMVLCENFRHKCVDFGGKRLQNETPEECAIRELFEESHGLIKIELKRLLQCPNLCFYGGRHAYKVYFVPVYGINYKKFESSAHLSPEMQETCALRTFDYQTFKTNYMENNGTHLFDITQEKCLLDHRIRRIFKESFKRGLLN
jgi:ADP-ribose pyrophosphatase YjhB (NUDIX family)